MNEQSTSAPAPSNHVFLHELSKQHPGAKVRFLCCVFEYDTTKGHLLVEHAYPADATPTPRAIVDVNLVLETIKGELPENGRWINVIGYVREIKQTQKVNSRKKTAATGVVAVNAPMIQAVLMWDAGAMRVNEYETTMEAQREAWKKTRHTHSGTK